MYVIYALVDPRNGKVHYVGMTDDVYKRFFAHIACSGSNFEKNAWIMAMRAENVMVQMLELERVEDIDQARKREAYWIRHCFSLHHPIANIVHVEKRANGLVESVPVYPDTSRFVPQGDDKMLPADRFDDLVFWYGKVGNVRGALEKMDMTNSRYMRHASFVLEQRGLKKRA